ncbi:MAG: sulfotransferase [Actinomycetota bacterium]
MTAANGQAPIFILGMLQRTGTNHLWDLFALHPNVETAAPVFEDHLVRWAPHLVAYADDVSRGWSPEWNVPPEEAEQLLRHLGKGVQQWLAQRSTKRIVTKMPTVEQAQHYFSLFPDSPLVVIVRDGRSVAESGVKSFGWSYERAFRRWNMAAEIVLQLQRDHGDRDGFAVVRYEDIIDKPGAVMRDLCVVADLDVDRYPIEEVESLPVRGSSTLKSDDNEAQLHWAPVERSGSFNPRERWRSWDEHLHRRFAAVAGASQVALGYDLEPVDGRDSVRDRLADLRAHVDVRYKEQRVIAGRARRSLRRVHGRI